MRPQKGSSCRSDQRSDRLSVCVQPEGTERKNRGRVESVLHQQSVAMDVPVSARRPVNVPVGRGAERFIEASGRNDRLTAATREVRHRAAAGLAERGGKASRLRQVETHDRCLARRRHRSAVAFTITWQECAVPVAFRQRQQWQFKKRSNGPSIANATSPHMQLPRNAAAILVSSGSGAPFLGEVSHVGFARYRPTRRQRAIGVIRAAETRRVFSRC